MIRLSGIRHKNSTTVQLKGSGRQNSQRLLHLSFNKFKFLPTRIGQVLLCMARRGILMFRNASTMRRVLVRYFLVLGIGAVPTARPIVGTTDTVLAKLGQHSGSISAIGRSSYISLQVQIDSSSWRDADH